MKGLNSGFTLIELMITIMVISILASIAVMILDVNQVIDDSKKVSAMQRLKNLRQSLTMYKMELNKYPNDLSSLYNNSNDKIYLSKDYIDNNLSSAQYDNFSYNPIPSDTSYQVELRINPDIKLILTPEELIETK
ncbi:MAG: type II secretion system protein [Bacillota bacterium]